MLLVVFPSGAVVCKVERVAPRTFRRDPPTNWRVFFDEPLWPTVKVPPFPAWGLLSEVLAPPGPPVKF